jgi:phage tail sheath gpL-like
LQGVPATPHVALIIAQQLAAGSASEGDIVPVPGEDSGDALFGAGSIAAIMCRAFKRQSPEIELYCAPIDDDGGTPVKAVGDFTLTGAATEAGEIAWYIAGTRVTTAVAVDDTAAAVATQAVADIGLVVDKLPVTVADGTGSVDCTARNAGTLGNDIDLRVSYYPGEKIPAGLTVTVNAMATGATDPANTPALNALGPNTVYHSIIQAFTDATSLTEIEGEMDSRWDAMDQRRGHAFAAKNDTQANMTTLGNGRNNQHNTIMGVGPSPTWHPVVAAQIAAADAKFSDPALPRVNTILRDVLPPAEADQYTRSQRDILLHDGISTSIVSGGRVLIERLITTYQTNPSAVPDPSYLDVCVMRTLEKIAYDVRAWFSSRYAQAKIASSNVEFGPGQKVLTPSVATAEMLSLFDQWLAAAIVERKPVLADGELLCEVNSGDPNRMDVQFSPDLMNQFRGLAGKLMYLL